jgi:hypothetical protein
MVVSGTGVHGVSRTTRERCGVPAVTPTGCGESAEECSQPAAENIGVLALLSGCSRSPLGGKMATSTK